VQRFVPQLVASFAVAAVGCPAPTPGSIGAVLAQTRADGRITVREAPPGLPAAQAGIGPGDELLLIDGVDVRSMSPQDVHKALEGEVGTTVHVTVLRHGRVDRIALRRAPIRSAVR
jgi:C-terminal processing protease CtpA/Prc